MPECAGSDGPVCPPEDVLWLLFKYATPTVTPELVAELSRTREYFGMAWLILFCVKKKKINVSLLSLDLSRSLQLSPRFLFLLLSFLAESTKRLSLGPSAVTGPALPLFLSFLEQSKKGTRLTSLHFAGGSIGPEEADKVLLSLPPSLQSLAVDDNSGGEKVIRALAKAVEEGCVSSLTSLRFCLRSVSRTSRFDPLFSSLCITEPSTLRLSSLSLRCVWGNMTSTWNPLQPADAWMHRLCLALYAPSLQSLKELRLEGPGILQSDIRILAKTIGEGRLQGVEVMEVETSAEINDDGVVEFAGALRGAVVPLLGRLRLSGRGCQEKGVKALLAALSSADRPPIQTLHVSVRGLGSEEAEGICSGKYSEFLTSLEVLDGPSGQKDSAGKTFAEAALRAEKPLPLYVLEMDNGSWHVHSLMVASLFVDLLGNQKVSNCLKRLKILCSTEETEPHVDVFRSLLCAKLPQLRTLHVENTNLTEADAMPLNEALQKDLLPSLQSLNILGKSIGRVWMEGFGQAVSEGKLVGLEHLCLTRTRVGEGLEFLTVPLGRGSLPRLSSLCLPQCCVNDRGMAALAGAIRTNDFAELTKLRLDGNPFGEEGLRAFAEAILGRPTTLLVLQSLFFGSPQGNWEGRALATGLNAGRLPSLKTFILSRALQNRQPGESEEPLPMVAFKSRLSEKNNDFRA